MVRHVLLISRLYACVETCSLQTSRLTLHASQEWYDLYSQTRTNDLARFFDFHLKDVANEWPQTAPVRMALLNFSKPALLDQEFADLPWHLPDVTRQKLHLSSPHPPPPRP